jgi:hypothetical protein
MDKKSASLPPDQFADDERTTERRILVSRAKLVAATHSLQIRLDRLEADLKRPSRSSFTAVSAKDSQVRPVAEEFHAGSIRRLLGGR